MGPTGVERKLAAILSADVKGYSRLMQADEVGTVRTLTTYRDVMATLIREHRGRVVDATGDNLLAEFPSVVDGVQCHALLSRIHGQRGLHEQAIAAGQRSVEVEPSNATAVGALALTMTYGGRPEEGLGLIRKAMRLNPHPPLYYFPTAVYASYLTGRYEAAIIEAKKFLRQQRHGPMARILWHWAIAGSMELGREAEARDEARKLLEQHPDTSLGAYVKAMKKLPVKDHAFVDCQVELLRKAGLPT